jgi:hypothetical protein
MNTRGIPNPEFFKLKSINSDRTPTYEYWTFIHIYNPKTISVVINTPNTLPKGHKAFIKKLKDYVVIKPYVVEEQFLKEYENMINRRQSGLTMSKRGTQNYKMDE